MDPEEILAKLQAAQDAIQEAIDALSPIEEEAETEPAGPTTPPLGMLKKGVPGLGGL